MTNIITVAITLVTITTATNNIVKLEPSGEVKYVTPVVSEMHIYEIDGKQFTNDVRVVTNATIRMVWCEVPLKIERDPLNMQDQPPMPGQR